MPAATWRQRMALPDTRHRARYLFVAVVVGHILLISAQVGTPAGPPLLQTALMGALSAAQRGVWAAVGGVRDVWVGYLDLRRVRVDNERLAQEVTDLRVRLQEERVKARGTEQLRALLDLRPRVAWTTVGAEVVAGSGSPDFRSISIDKGRADGLQPDMPVIAPAGVVGRVAVLAGRAATVQLLIDRNAAAAAVIERSRTQGIALGNGDGTLRLEYLSATANIQPGDLVVTAGTDRIYPRGLVLGSVAQVDRSGPTYRRVTIKPAVDFSTLETVLVMLAPAPAAAATEGQAAR